MPSNKKKRGRAKKIAMKDKLAAAQASGDANNSNTTHHNLPSAVYPHQSPFAVPETPAKTLQRVLGYKFVCDMEDERPITITQRDDGDGGGQDGNNKYRLTYLDDGGQSYNVTTAYLQEKMYDLLPDYDRNSAAFPISRKLMERELPSISKDLTRKVMKLFDSVPEAERDVFMKFVNRGDGITVSVSCVRATGILALVPLGMYNYKVDLVGAGENGENSFEVTTTDGTLTFKFEGDLQAHCLQRYHKELALLLMQECMTRVSLGTAELRDVPLDSSDEIVNVITNALDAMYVEMKRWAELVSVRAWLFEKTVESKSCLTRVGTAACSLGEALEACGHYSKAAVIYAECGKYFYDAKHPKAANLLGNAGLAWKRHEDWENAESFYAASIESTRFIYDPIECRGSLLTYLKNLWYLWDQAEIDDTAVAKMNMALRELIFRAGESSEQFSTDANHNLSDNGIPALRNDLCNMSEKQALRVLKSIAEKSTSVEAMREAINSCANQYAFEFKFRLSNKGKVKPCKNKNRSRQDKDVARQYIQNHKSLTSIVTTCGACGKFNDEKVFKKCSAW
jgi:tetratricopeptide (TPR) repeat protein